MKNNIIIISFLLLSLSIAGQNLQTEGSQHVSGRLSVYQAGITPDNAYNGNLVITKPVASGQYINLIRQGKKAWSIGTVYNSNTFAIGNGETTDASFTNPYFSLTEEGNVGVGILQPSAKFEVNGKIKIFGDIYGSNVLSFQDDTRFNVTQSNIPDLLNSSFSMPYYGIAAPNAGSSADLWLAGNNAIRMFTAGNAAPVLNITKEGRVGIGTIKPTDMLSVNGIIRAKEVKIDLCEDLADYVFSPDYSLMPLNEVESYVKTNKHLPEIPSAAEVKENGLSMGEMQNKLLQKIEELTLYVIEQQKQIDSLKKDLRSK